MLYFLVYGLFKTLINNIQASTSILITKIVKISVMNIAFLVIAISAIQLLAGIPDYSQILLLSIFPKMSLIDWIYSNLLLMIKSSVILTVLFLFGITIAFLLIVVINPKEKDGTKKSRKLVMKEMVHPLSKGKFVTVLIEFFIVIFICVLLFNSANFMITNGGELPEQLQFFLFLGAGWDRFVGAVVIIYFIITMWLINQVRMIRSNNEDQNVFIDNPLSRILPYISKVAYAMIIIIPLYTYGVYRHLPQQIGGGRLLPIEVSISDADLNTKFTYPNHTIYLVDRTQNSSIFLLLDNNAKKFQIIEIPNSSIKATIYNP